MITYFKVKNNKSKRISKKYELLTTILKTFDTIVITATPSSSFTLSLTGIGLIVKPISTGKTYRLSIGNKGVYEIVMREYSKNKPQNEKDQQTINSFEKL